MYYITSTVSVGKTMVQVGGNRVTGFPQIYRGRRDQRLGVQEE